MLGVVPLTIPLAWQVVVTNALFLARGLVRNRSRLGEAALSGAICTAYDFILEPFATRAKQYWIWRGAAVPPENYLAWFVVSGLLVCGFAPRVPTRFPRDSRPALILGVTLLIFLAGGFA
jgi:putative membrane protein